MSFDAPYDGQGLLLKPWQGAVAGGLGGLVAHFATHNQGEPYALLSFGVVAGLMYALCQQRAPLYGLAAVGLFYGFFLWLLFGVLLGGLVLDSATAEDLHSRRWLLGGLAYGATLATLASVWSVTHTQTARQLPKD